MRVLQVKSPLMQYNEYYPFGLQTANSYTRENTKNNFLYNAGTELNSTSGMYDLFFRNYDPALGRMHGVDPMAGKYSGLSPYNYSFNDPVYWNDPMGDDAGGSAAFEKKFGSGGGGYEDAHAGGDGDFNFGYSWSAFGSVEFGDANVIGSAAWNIASYGSYSGVGGKTSLDFGFGGNYNGRWEKYVIDPGGRVGPREPRYRQGEPKAVNIPPTYGYRFVPSKSDRVGRGPSIGGEQQQTQNGPRLFANEGDAYRYMWNSSFDADGKVQQEVAAFLTSKGVLVLPTEGTRTNGEYAKNGPRISYNDFLPLSRKDGNLFVTFNDTKYQVLGQVHTHPNVQPFGSYEVASDLVTQSVLGVSVYLIRTNGFYNTSGTVLGTQQEFFNGTKSLIGGK